MAFLSSSHYPYPFPALYIFVVVIRSLLVHHDIAGDVSFNITMTDDVIRSNILVASKSSAQNVLEIILIRLPDPDSFAIPVLAALASLAIR